MTICGECKNHTKSIIDGFVNCNFEKKWQYFSESYIHKQDCLKFIQKSQAPVCLFQTTKITTSSKISSKKSDIMSQQFNPFKGSK